ncbi:MAG TPA: energy transducer TonB, partial [Alphaproteobacteria bacterium]
PKPTPQADKPKPTPKTEAPKPEKVKPAPKEKVAEVAPKKAAPAPAKPEQAKPEPSKTEEVKTEEPAEDQAEFSSVLKNLVGEEAPPQPDSVPRDTPRQAPQLTSPAPLGSQMSMSEMDALRAQLAQCWRVLPGARDAATLVVDIEVTVGPNKIVQSSHIVDQLRYNSDSFFRAAADSALAALRSPTCTPLDLPSDKYDQWKNMTVRFDPKDMF